MKPTEKLNNLLEIEGVDEAGKIDDKKLAKMEKDMDIALRKAIAAVESFNELRWGLDRHIKASKFDRASTEVKSSKELEKKMLDIIKILNWGNIMNLVSKSLKTDRKYASGSDDA